ncbi:hypothetical protein [Allostreptomyces psammosilenae]|uniref:Uncharacterized protein n=1 Tax=Allostreptomyces psammosilenae TaxID=1892865 RepID=A0A853A6S7_9ACTN|nr:hypothetical protein [Allostreptomyces psammosilenae]NYI06172.1 hypothetical protein [Allostreptomyces psammosilenae]
MGVAEIERFAERTGGTRDGRAARRSRRGRPDTSGGGARQWGDGTPCQQAVPGKEQR